jgi:hypothetical protein
MDVTSPVKAWQFIKPIPEKRFRLGVVGGKYGFGYNLRTFHVSVGNPDRMTLKWFVYDPDNAELHRSSTEQGAKLFVVD